MADQIRIFTSGTEEARRILEAHSIRYIVACNDEAELNIYAKNYPEGLWAQLVEGQKPDWLKPVHIRDSNLDIWMVRSKKLSNSM